MGYDKGGAKCVIVLGILTQEMNIINLNFGTYLWRWLPQIWPETRRPLGPTAGGLGFLLIERKKKSDLKPATDVHYVPPSEPVPQVPGEWLR